MHWRCALGAMLAISAATNVLAVEFPYVAYVNSADVYVRSGPGRNYYPTDKLPKGEKVEIYRHDPGGWYAIRPPRQSFSWVSSRHLDTQGDGLAVVNSPRVVARVGSAFSDVRDIIQVRLDKGEKVELIDSPTGESSWCKIAPPAGEFRWIFAKFVDRNVPEDVAQDEREAAGERIDADTDGRREGAVRLASGEREAESEPAASEPRATTTRASDSREASGDTAVLKELDYIEMKLSAMIAQEVSQWSFADLRRRADAVMKEARTPIERGRVHVLIDKLARFDDIKQRHEALQRTQQETAGQPAAQAGSVARRNDDPRFDGVGRLSPVISQKTGDPQYALVDASNAVISFVTPAPGVNLRPLLDKYVGVNGQRGFLTELQRQHISVQRVTVIDVQRR